MPQLGLLEQGNIDVSKIAPVKNPDGSVSTVRTISIGTDRGETLIPTVIGGRIVTDNEAVKEFRKTGKHLGVFDTPENATIYAQNLHKSEERRVMPQYSRAQLLEAVRTDHPQFRDIPDNKLFAAIAQDHPDLAQGISELHHPAFQSPRYGPQGATAGQVAQDQAAEVLKGIPEAVTGIPGALKSLGTTAYDALTGKAGKVAQDLGGMAGGIAQPFKQAVQGAAEYVAPGSQGPQVAPESPEWAQAARASGTMLAGAELPNAISGLAKIAGPAVSGAMQQIRSKLNASNPVTTAELNRWMDIPAKEVAHGANPAQQLVKEGLVGADKTATHANVKSALGSAGSDLEAALKTADQTGVTVDAQTPTYDSVAKATKKIGRPREAAFQATLDGIVDDIESRYPNLDKLSPSQAHALKVELGDSIKWSGVGYEEPANQAMLQIYRDLNKAIKTNVNGIGPLQDRWGNLYIASKNLAEGISENVVGKGTAAEVPRNPTNFERMKAATKPALKYGAKAAGLGALGAAGYQVYNDLKQP